MEYLFYQMLLNSERLVTWSLFSNLQQLVQYISIQGDSQYVLIAGVEPIRTLEMQYYELNIYKYMLFTG